MSVDDFEHAQRTRALRQARRTYLLRGLLCCALCGRRMEGAWNNGRANYRCHHLRATGTDLPRSVFVREDKIVPDLAALLIRFKNETTSHRSFEDADVPRDVAGQVAMCRELGLTLRYDHRLQVLAVHDDQGEIAIRLL